MRCKYEQFSGLRAVAAVLAVIFLSMTSAASAQEGERVVVDRIVAVVNGEMVTLYDMNMAMQPILGKFQGKTLTPEDEAALNEYRLRFLQRMVDDILIKQDAEKWQIEVSDREVEAEIDSVKQRNNLDDEALERQLKFEGLTLEEYKKNIRDGLLKHRILAGRVKRKVVVTEDEVRAEYENNKAEYEDLVDEDGNTTKHGVHVSIIILPPAQSGAELKRSIDAGETSFADAAKEHSIGPSAEQGGDLGIMAWNDLAPQWQEILSKLQPGQVSTPFAVNEHQALLMITPDQATTADTEETAAQTPQGYDELRDKIHAKLYQEKLESLFQEYLEKLRANAVVDKKL